MFLLPTKIYSKFLSRLLNLVGPYEVRRIFTYLGELQGSFSVDYFKKKYNIVPDFTSSSFITEQYQFQGLGKVTIDFNGFDKKIIFKEKSFIVRGKEFLCDFYFVGMIKGSLESIFEKSCIVDFVGEVDDNFIFEAKLTDFLVVQNDDIFKKRYYELGNTSLDGFLNQSKEMHNILLEHNLEFTESGVVMFGEKHIFQRLSLFTLVYYFFLELDNNEEIKKLFFDSGHDVAKLYSTNCDCSNYSLNDRLNILSYCGFGSVDIVLYKKNKVTIGIKEGLFELVAKKLFVENYSVLNNDFKVGFCVGIVEYVLNKEIKNYSLISKNGSLVLDIDFD